MTRLKVARPKVTRPKLAHSKLAHPGMTLAEALVGLVLLGLVAALGLSALGLVGRAGVAAGADAGPVGAAQDLLRLRLLGMMPLVGEGRAGRPALLFEGDATRMAFPVELPHRFGEAGPSLVELGSGGGALRLSWRPLPSAAPGEGAVGRVLLDGVASLRLRYFGAPRATEPAIWRDRWADANALPAAVEVTVAFRDGDPRHWPPLIVAPRLARAPGALSEGSAR